MKKNIICFLGAFFSLFVISANVAQASEGKFNLRNQVGEDARCSIDSVLMSDQRYHLLVSCRDIIYPGGTEVFNYVLWINPNAGGNPIRLGVLGMGKVPGLRTDKAFNSAFVTKELTATPRTPSGTVVMKGNWENNSFLDNRQPAENDTNSELGDPTPTSSAKPGISGPNNIFRILAAGGIVAFLGLFGIILIIFVVSRR